MPSAGKLNPLVAKMSGFPSRLKSNQTIPKLFPDSEWLKNSATPNLSKTYLKLISGLGHARRGVRKNATMNRFTAWDRLLELRP